MKHIITYSCLTAAIIAGGIFGRLNANFFCGALAGAGGFALITYSAGRALARKASERMDKQHRDRLEETEYQRDNQAFNEP